jgi:DNA uptake protein ComE-like DNA-binding protein
MFLSRKQHIGAIILFGTAILIWLAVALWPSRQTDLPDPQPAPTNPKRSWAQRRDSIQHADSVRYAQWAADREKRYDSARLAAHQRHEEWKAERQAFYDSIRQADSLWRDSVGIPYIPRVKKDTVLDLNHCDTAELQYIRGIGRYTAVQIVKYREKLGGFYSPEQLTDEVFGKLSLDTLLHHFTANPADVQRIPVNTCSIERLQRHPYLRYEQAKDIYNLRRKQLRLTSVSDLSALPSLTTDDLHRLTPYLSFE